MPRPHPPRLPLRFFRWFCHPDLRDSIEGDLMELYGERVGEIGERKADWKFTKDVLLLFRPGIIKQMEGYQPVNNIAMYKSYFKIGWRNLVRNKGYSMINIGGLALGMAVAITIGL
ncbi:permease prefix domain 2-containing transporter [Aquiflexum sp.]|uniref:permease prefix domain 2-containing transporter n=1 Tax=Aquiflexum sp. TaxID=1872584 RepID=UPI003593F99D